MIERSYSRSSNATEGWMRSALCDICRRYMPIGTCGGGADRIEGTCFCAQCSGDCRWPASDELVAAWRAWAETRAAAWARAEAEGKPIREWRCKASAHGLPLGLPVGRVGARIGGRVIA